MLFVCFEGLTCNVSVLTRADGGVCVCSASSPGVRDGGNPYSPARQDDRRPPPAAHLACERHDDGAHWDKGRRGKRHKELQNTVYTSFTNQEFSTLTPNPDLMKIGYRTADQSVQSTQIMVNE